MKKIKFALGLMVLLFVKTLFAGESSLCQWYPHWNCHDPAQVQVLTQIETFITKHSINNKGVGIAAFDWDGTLYDEHIPNPNVSGDNRSGQSIWHIWGANHLNQFPYLFPSFKTNTLAEQANDILRKDAYLEGRTFQPINPSETDPLLPSGYDKFSQIATFESGMTLQQMRNGLQGYLANVTPKQYAFTRLLDIMQRMQDKGFVIWIVSGSNPYYLANLFSVQNGLNNKLGYHLLPGCMDTINAVTFEKNCHIAGNAAKIKKSQSVFEFTNVYDDRFVKNAIRPMDREIVDRYGKQLFLQQLSKKLNLPVVFYAGNSDGDTFAMTYTLSRSDTMGIFVQPTLSKSTSFLQLLNSSVCAGRCIDIENPK